MTIYIEEKATASLSLEEFWSLSREDRKNFYVYVWQFDTDYLTGPKITHNKLEDIKMTDAINFLNHSCDPNLAFDGPLMVKAWRDIKSGEEFTYDYLTSETHPFYEPFDCHCGSKNCRKRLTSVDYRLKENQKKFEKNQMFPLVQKMIEIENKMQVGEGPYHELNRKLILKESSEGKGLFATEKILKDEPIWIDQVPWDHDEKELTIEQVNFCK